MIIPIVLIVFCVIVINLLQNKFPNKLPKLLQTWEFLPLGMRSLKPYDAFFTKYICFCKCLNKGQEQDDDNDSIKKGSKFNSENIPIIEIDNNAKISRKNYQTLD